MNDILTIKLHNDSDIIIDSSIIYFDKRFQDSKFKVIISIEINIEKEIEYDKLIDRILKLNYEKIDYIKINDTVIESKIRDNYKIFSSYLSNTNPIFNKVDKNKRYLNLIFEYSNIEGD